MTTRRLAGVACVVLLASSAVSCSSTDTSTTPRSTSSASAAGPTSAAGATPAVCADLASLRASVKSITSSPKGQGGLPGLSSELATVRATLDRLPADASTQYAGEVDAVRTASRALEGSVRDAKDSPSAATLGAVSADVVTLGATVSTLASAVAGTC